MASACGLLASQKTQLTQLQRCRSPELPHHAAVLLYSDNAYTSQSLMYEYSLWMVM